MPGEQCHLSVCSVTAALCEAQGTVLHLEKHIRVCLRLSYPDLIEQKFNKPVAFFTQTVSPTFLFLLDVYPNVSYKFSPI